jgi:lysophospholipase L1-like esterase
MKTQSTLTCAFLSLLCCLPVGAAAITIMPLGDSITAGYTGNPSEDAPGGYRNNLYADLTAAGININFVGTSNQNPSPLLTANNETSNEGASGYLIKGVPLASYPGGFYPGLYENTDSWFSTFQPAIVLLMIGTNDINMNIDLPNAPARLGMLLDKITADDPHGTIILSTLIYTTDPTLNPLVAAYNAALPAVAATRPNVVLVDNSNVLDLSTDYASTLHPNQQGYNKLGDAFASEVEAAIAPEPSSVWLAGLGLLMVPWRAARGMSKRRRSQ